MSLIAAATSQSENYLAYWLDLYYQVRKAYEAAENETELSATGLLADTAPAYPAPPRTMNTPRAPEPPPEDFEAEAVTETDGGASAPAERTDAAHGGAAKAAIEKRAIKERLDAARAHGVTVRQIVKAGEGNITEDQIREIIDCHRMPIAVYRVLDAALHQIAGAAAV